MTTKTSTATHSVSVDCEGTVLEVGDSVTVFDLEWGKNGQTLVVSKVFRCVCEEPDVQHALQGPIVRTTDLAGQRLIPRMLCLKSTRCCNECDSHDDGELLAIVERHAAAAVSTCGCGHPVSRHHLAGDCLDCECLGDGPGTYAGQGRVVLSEAAQHTYDEIVSAFYPMGASS